MSLIDCLPEPILLLGNDGSVIDANRRAEALFDRGSLSNCRLTDLLDLDTDGAARLVARWRSTSKPRPARVVLDFPYGSVAFIAYGANVRLWPEGPRRIVVRMVAEDEAVRPFVNLRQRVGWLSTRLARERRMKREAEQAHAREREANRARDRFLAMMSHELRTPLNAILGFSEIIRDGHLRTPSLETYTAYAADIHRSAGHLLALVDSILQLSSIEEGRLETKKERIAGRQLIGTCLQDVQPFAERRGIRIEERAASGRFALTGDEGMLRQILINLLTNAIKYSPVDGKIRLRVRRTGEGVVVSVIDRGPGMHPTHIERALRPFERLKDPVVSNQEGIGLGLAIVDRFARANGYRFTIWSRPGLGTVASISCDSGPAQLRAC